MVRVELLNTGTELLMGFVLNTHAAYLGQKLSELGVSVARQVCVNDDPREMKQCLNEAMQRADLIIITGGLGPTGDDLTRNCVVEMLGLKTSLDPRALENIQQRFRRRGGAMPESVKCQAMVPETATVLYNEHGTAPGLAIPLEGVRKVSCLLGLSPLPRGTTGGLSSDLTSPNSPPLSLPLGKGEMVGVRRGESTTEFPDTLFKKMGVSENEKWRCRWLIMLPGPPRELRPMFEEQVIPLIRREFSDVLPMVDCRVFRVAGMGESSVEERVHPVLKELKDLEIGYCARPGEVDVRLVVRGNSTEEVRHLADEAEQRTRKALGAAIFGTGSQTLEEGVVNLLREKKKRVTTAESCTGGYVAHRITLVPGSSGVFMQGWVTYSDEAKTQLLGVPSDLIQKEGAVSEVVAKRMAESALQKSGADYALSLTGIAGPSGGSAEKPVGTVWIALASKQDSFAERFCFQLDRETFKFICAQTALNMLRLRLGNDD